MNFEGVRIHFLSDVFGLLSFPVFSPTRPTEREREREVAERFILGLLHEV